MEFRQRSVDIEDGQLRVRAFFHRKGQCAGQLGPCIDDVNRQVGLVHRLQRGPVQQRQDRGDVRIGAQPNDAGRAILDRDIRHDERRPVYRHRRLVGRCDHPGIHADNKAIARKARMTAAVGDIRHGAQESNLGTLKIKVEVSLRCLARLQTKGKVNVAQRAGVDIFVHPLAGLWFDVFWPKLKQARWFQRVQPRIQRNLPPLRPRPQIPRQVQRRPPVDDSHTADGHVKRVESDFGIQVGTLNRHRGVINIGRVSHQIAQTDLCDQFAKFTAVINTQTCGPLDPARHPFAFDRKLVKTQQTLIWIIAEIAAGPVKGDRRSTFIRLNHTGPNLQRRVQRLEGAVLVKAAAHRTGDRRAQHFQPSKCRVLHRDVTRAHAIEIDAELRRGIADFAAVVGRKRGNIRPPAQNGELGRHPQVIAFAVQQQPPAIHRPHPVGLQIGVAQGQGAQLYRPQPRQRLCLEHRIKLADQLRHRGRPPLCRGGPACCAQRDAAILIAPQIGHHPGHRNIARLHIARQQALNGKTGPHFTEGGKANPLGVGDIHVPQPNARPPPFVHDQHHLSKADPRKRHIFGKPLFDARLEPFRHDNRAADHIDGSPCDGGDNQRNNQQRPFGGLPKSSPLGGTGGCAGVGHGRPVFRAAWGLSFAKPD